MTVPAEVKAAYLVNHIDTLTSSQLSHWCEYGWLKPMKGPGYGSFKTFARSEYVKAKYMTYLVNRIGFTPNAAADIADMAVKADVIQNGRVWVNYHGLMLGIPEIRD